MAFYRGKAGPCFWALALREFDDLTADRFVENLRTVVRTIEVGEVVLDVLFDVPMPSPVQRRKIVTALRGAEGLQRTAGHALVINSSIGRGLLTAINWTVRPPYEEKVFSRPREGLDWLAGLTQGLDPDRVMEDIAQASPEFHILRW